MRERKAVEKVVERLYKDRLERTGRLPSGKETRDMERKVRKAAEASDKTGARR